MQSMELKKLLSYTRQAVDDYKLIEEGDHMRSVFPVARTLSLSSTRLPDSDAFIQRNSHSWQSPSIWDMTLLILLP